MQFKKILCILLCLTMLVGILAGCGTEKPPTSESTTPATEPTDTSELEPTPTPEPTPEPSTAATVLTAEKDAELHAQLQARIDEILNTETEIVHSDTYIPGETYTGTAYYISNDGDDNNDGLTPETAWQTLQALVNYEDGGRLKPGDAVFFRRGDIFRLQDSQIQAVNIHTDRITLSAYGEGAKPIITFSSENGTGAEKWENVYDENGVKIWRFYRDMLDTAIVIMNDGEVFSKRVYEFWKIDGYISCEDTHWSMHDDHGVELLDELLPLERSMTENYNLISRPERFSSEHEGYGSFIDAGYGPLYLRCDEGNPGELFESIEFSERGGTLLLLGGSDTVIDNISFRCDNYIASNVPTEMDGIEAVANTLIQNCEFAYGGACVTYYNGNDNGLYAVCPQSDGIYNVVNNTCIRNNYFHDSQGSTSTYEADISYTDHCEGYFHVIDNVMVNTGGIRMDSTSERLQYLNSVIIRGNQIWNTGRMDNGKYFYSEGSIVLMPNHYGECIIEENILYTTENGHPLNGLIDTYTYSFEEFEDGYDRPVFRNNTYVQYADRDFAYYMYQGENGEHWQVDAPDLLTKAAELLGDTTSEFYVIERNE